MTMPDFSFLQNQQGNTSFGDLAKGLAQGAQLGMNIQNMKLQQAAQQQHMELAQQEYALKATDEAMKLNDAAIKAQRQEYLQKALFNASTRPIETTGIIAPGGEPARVPLPPDQAALNAAEVYQSVGMAKEARDAIQNYVDLIKEGRAYKPGETKSFDVPTIGSSGEKTTGTMNAIYESPTFNSGIPGLPQGWKPAIGGPAIKTPLVNVNMGESEAVKDAFKTRDKVLTDQQSAYGELASLTRAEKNLAGLPTGPITNATLPMRQFFAQAFGVQEGEVGKYLVSREAMREGAMVRIKGLGSGTSLTDSDRKYSDEMYSLSQNTSGRRDVAQYLSTIPQRKIDYADAMVKYMDAHDRKLVPGGGTKSFDQIWNDWYKNNESAKIEATVGVTNSKLQEYEQVLANEISSNPQIATTRIQQFKKEFGYTPWFAYEGFR